MEKSEIVCTGSPPAYTVCMQGPSPVLTQSRVILGGGGGADFSSSERLVVAAAVTVVVRAGMFAGYGERSQVGRGANSGKRRASTPSDHPPRVEAGESGHRPNVASLRCVLSKESPQATGHRPPELGRDCGRIPRTWTVLAQTGCWLAAGWPCWPKSGRKDPSPHRLQPRPRRRARVRHESAASISPRLRTADSNSSGDDKNNHEPDLFCDCQDLVRVRGARASPKPPSPPGPPRHWYASPAELVFLACSWPWLASGWRTGAGVSTAPL